MCRKVAVSKQFRFINDWIMSTGNGIFKLFLLLRRVEIVVWKIFIFIHDFFFFWHYLVIRIVIQIYLIPIIIYTELMESSKYNSLSVLCNTIRCSIKDSFAILSFIKQFLICKKKIFRTTYSVICDFLLIWKFD